MPDFEKMMFKDIGNEIKLISLVGNPKGNWEIPADYHFKIGTLVGI